MGKKRKAACGTNYQHKKGLNYRIKYIGRFTGRDTVHKPWYFFMDPIGIRLYYGGQFVLSRGQIVYEGGELGLYPEVDEVCYFEFKDWLRKLVENPDDCEFWYRKKGCTLKTGRAQIKDDRDIPSFLDAPEKDGWYHLFAVHVLPKGGK